MIAQKKGVNVLERGSQVHAMAEFQELLDFPPAPKLDVFGKLDPRHGDRGRAARRAGVLRQGALRGVPHAARSSATTSCTTSRPSASTTPIADERAGWPSADGPIKTFPLRGIKDSPPYLHDGRLLTLDDTVEFFNLVLGLRLTDEEKRDLVRYLYAL